MTDPAAFRQQRDELVADAGIAGAALRARLTELTDAWLAALYADAVGTSGIDGASVALVALGGYGRGELCPGSDLDLLVVHDGDADAAARLAEAIWYPVWDTGIHLGHSVRSLADVAKVVGDDIETSTALSDARRLAGSEQIAALLGEKVRDRWTATLSRSVAWLAADAANRRVRNGDVAFSVEPNIKTAAGGLRDAQIPVWISRGGVTLNADDLGVLAAARDCLLDVRVALHRLGTGTADVLGLEDQDPVADALGYADADALMTAVARAARDVCWVLDETWLRAEATGAGRRRRRRTDPALVVDDGDDVDAHDPVAVVNHLVDSARDGRRLSRPFLARLAAELPMPPCPWSVELRHAFVALLGTGSAAISIIEALDQVGVWERFVPEWPAVRTRAQRTTHHRFTVDRHLLEAVAIAGSLVGRVTRPDLLLVATLLHDLGKGRGGDHTEIGVELAGEIGPRMGFDAADTAVIQSLVANHLLLPEVATRRDIAAASTIVSVADTLGSIEVLGLLAALTEADARATGPTAWTDWKVGLFRTLVERVGAQLQGAGSDQYGPMFPSVDQMLLLRAGTTTVTGEGRTLTVVAPDRARLFCRVTGALVLAGLSVVSAAVTSSDGMALEEFVVAPAFANAELASTIEVDWPKVIAQVEAAMSGRVAIAARVAERADTYRRRLRSANSGVHLRFDDTDDATIVEVDAPDGIGLLYAVTRALADLDVDIRFARVETLTDRVVDAFSIVDSNGDPIIDEDYRGEIERAIRHAITG